MIIVCTASADTYITNKIVNGDTVVTDANVGRAGTLDLFKLYNETSLNGVANQTELSRVLLKFDLQPIFDLTGSILDLNSQNFKTYLQLFDITAGNPSPSNFNLIVFPLSQSFNEGVGRDISAFNDIDVANFITASYSTNNVLWFATGANAKGTLGANNIDCIEFGNLGNGTVSLFANQHFVNGNEDMNVDVTTIVSATVAGLLPNHGMRISFSGTEETDSKTRFVKRFASRHVANQVLRPRLFVKFNDCLQDNTSNFEFDTSGSLFLQTFVGSAPANMISGSSLTKVTGNNCLLLELHTGSFNFVVTGSQHTAGTNKQPVAGVYSASFAIASNNSTIVTGTETLANFIAASGSINFTTTWKSLDSTFGYFTGSLNITRPTRVQGNFTTRKPLLRINNSNPYYTPTDTIRFRVFGIDLEQQFHRAVKRQRKLMSAIYEKVYYQVFDRISGNIVIPYDTATDSTRLSTDAEGMFFDFKMQALAPGRTYGFQFLIVERGQSYLSKEDDTFFDVRS